MLINRKLKPKIEIEFGNLKEDFESNFYLATEERAVANKKYKCVIKNGSIFKGDYYVRIKDDSILNKEKLIDLRCFKNYKIIYPKNFNYER